MDIVLMMGRVLSDGRLSARVKYDVNDRFSIKANAQVCFPLFDFSFQEWLELFRNYGKKYF